MKNHESLQYKEFLVRWIDRVWTQEDADAIDEMFVSDGPAHGLGAQAVIGPDEFRQFHTILLKLVGDVQISIDHMIEQGDWFSYVGTFKARCRKTGREITMSGGAMCHVKDGKMTVAYNTWDFLNLFVGLGLAPEDAFTRGLSGQSLFPTSS